jgi:hypothetical protein
MYHGSFVYLVSHITMKIDEGYSNMALFGTTLFLR